jgi:hypothetical protein
MHPLFVQLFIEATDDDLLLEEEQARSRAAVRRTRELRIARRPA